MLTMLAALVWLMSICLGIYLVKYRQMLRLPKQWFVLLYLIYLLVMFALTYILIFLMMFGYNS
ncbi:hypothetical protein [Streptococcus fryi]